MEHLLQRLPDFPDPTSIGHQHGLQRRRQPHWRAGRPALGQRDRQDPPRPHLGLFSLTEGENNIVPHYRFRRLFDRRREEQQAGRLPGRNLLHHDPLLNQLVALRGRPVLPQPVRQPRHAGRRLLSKPSSAPPGGRSSLTCCCSKLSRIGAITTTSISSRRVSSQNERVERLS